MLLSTTKVGFVLTLSYYESRIKTLCEGLASANTAGAGFFALRQICPLGISILSGTQHVRERAHCYFKKPTPYLVGLSPSISFFL